MIPRGSEPPGIGASEGYRRIVDRPPKDTPGGAVKQLRVFLDFDGTLVGPNVAIELVERFCEDGQRVAHEVDEELHAGRLTLREAWARQVALIPPGRVDEMVQFAVREIPLRKGAREFLGLLRDYSVPTAIVSGGLDFFIRPVLEREGLDFPLFSDTVQSDAEGRLSVAHPFGHSSCRLCGICKAQVIVGNGSYGIRNVFVGDGSTDKYAAEVADIVFARHRLKLYCESAGIPFFPFEGFEPVTSQVGRWLSGVEPLPPRRPAGISASVCPISSALSAVGAGPLPPGQSPPWGPGGPFQGNISDEARGPAV
jgi:2-hydroxy-3-keto-5-methylthiopentenyl-1-phosphate phosphatase